jgi:hypothetical protein
MSVFSVFCIGTGHTQGELNNTMKSLYDDCQGARYINDGLLKLRAASGRGLNEMARDTMVAIQEEMRKTRQVWTRVNLAGHSRGAILCHMLARRITETWRPMEITLALIDPVHMSKEEHPGAETLARNDKILAYQAIIMENENTPLPLGPGGKFYPFKFIRFLAAEDRAKVNYINMPGTHGSATQALTHPVAKVARELIANFMRRRGTVFASPKVPALDMCELFAQINLQNPFNRATGKRKIWNDKGDAQAHVAGRHSWQSSDSRASSVDKALQHSYAYFPGKFKILIDPRQGGYFINQKHAMFFSKAFPNHWKLLETPNRVNVPGAALEAERLVMEQHDGLKGTFHLLADFILDPMNVTL